MNDNNGHQLGLVHLHFQETYVHKYLYEASNYISILEANSPDGQTPKHPELIEDLPEK